MGQCSSSSSSNKRGNKAEVTRTGPEVDEEEEEDHDEVIPATGDVRRRTALDQGSVGRRACSANVPETGSGRQDFGLASIRASIDDGTCAALLALRTGRGSSVGGISSSQKRGSQERTSRDSRCTVSHDALGPVPEVESREISQVRSDQAQGARAGAEPQDALEHFLLPNEHKEQGRRASVPLSAGGVAAEVNGHAPRISEAQALEGAGS